MKDSLNVKLEEAELLMKSGKFGASVKLLETLTQEFPEEAVVWHDLGAVYMTRFDADLKVQELWEDHTDERSAAEAASNAFKQAVKLDDGFVPALNNLGTLYALDQNWEEAVRVWERSLEENPDQPSVQDDLELARKEIS